MGQVRVYNDNTYVYRERFMDDDIVIEAGKYITMDEQKAVRFRGTYSPVELDHDGKPLPKSYKMIRLEKVDAQASKVEEKFSCMACAKDFTNQKSLDQHIDASHQEQWADAEHKDKKAKEKNA